MLSYGILTGLAVAAGLLLVGYGIRRPNPRLLDAISALAGAGTDTVADRTVYPDDPIGWKARVGTWADHHLAGRLGLSTPVADLTLIQRSRSWYWTEKTTGALGGFLAPGVITAADLLLGSPLPVALPAFLSLGMGVYLWFAPDAKVRSQAGAARSDFSEAAVAYLQSMALLRSAGAIAQTAMIEAASTSDAWMFRRIREEISRANLAGVSAYDGIAALGDRTGIEVLRESGDIMRLAGQEGTGVSDSLLAQARGMRAQLLAQELERAHERTTQMNAPIVLIVCLLLVVAGLPAAAQLFF